MLSKKAQEIMANQGRWVSRKDVKYQVDPGQVSYKSFPRRNGASTNKLFSSITGSLYARRAEPSQFPSK